MAAENREPTAKRMAELHRELAHTALPDVIRQRDEARAALASEVERRKAAVRTRDAAWEWKEHYRARAEQAEEALEYVNRKADRTLARAREAEARTEKLRAILGHLCVNPDEVGRSCGECLPCQLVDAARRAASRGSGSPGSTDE